MRENTLTRWFGHRQNPGLVGIEFCAEGIALAYINSESINKKTSHLLQCEFLSCNTVDSGRAELLRECIQTQQLLNAKCNIVLPAGAYQLLLIEAPKVSAEELRDAVRWRIKELIHFPLEEAVIDVFPLPADVSRAGASMIYVVAARRDIVQQSVALVAAAGMRIASIDITELALRNLAELCADDSRGVALVKLRPGAGSLVLIRGGNLYLSREFDLAYNAGLFDELPENQLVLELQRSLDYYERQMGQVPPPKIYLCGENVSADKITETMRINLAATLEVLNPGVYLGCSAKVDGSVLSLCLGAIGGALRKNYLMKDATRRREGVP